MQAPSKSSVTDSFEATVRESTLLTPEESTDEVRHILLAVEKAEFNPEAGQSIAVLVPGPHEFGNPEHRRFYSIADVTEQAGTVAICVKRCFYIDEISGERYPGVASNYLCDLRPGDTVTITGPHENPFSIPQDKPANLLMFGLGTGIAPFRAFIKHIYDAAGGWEGQVRLFYGAKSGLELLYMNDQRNDLAQYYDEETFKAFEAVSPRPHMDDPVALERSIEENAEEVAKLLRDPNTHVYVAGLDKIRGMLDKALTNIAGSEEKWGQEKAKMIADGRWTEVTY